jgi:hypothetical protein
VKTETPVVSRSAIFRLIRIKMNPDSKRPDKAVDGAVCGRGGMIRNRAEYLTTEPLNTGA